MEHSHRPTTKHVNKAFKKAGGHASKHALKGGKGRSSNLSNAKAVKSQESKAARRNKAKQLQRTKHSNVKELKAPRVIALVSLCSDVEPLAILQALFPSDAFHQHNGIYYTQLVAPKHALKV
jgi:hypothetical protein